MPVEAKPLFRPDVLRSHMAGFDLPPPVEATRAKLERWAELIASRRIDNFTEQQILPDFLADFFVGLLGYTRPADATSRYTLQRETHVEVDGKFADAALGDFNGEARYVVALEGKGPRDPLDRPYAGRHMSAVDQGYRYAINLPCDWIIVTSMRWTRLYFKGSDQHTYELFDTERLADDENALGRFIFLLGADRVVPTAGRCHLYSLLEESQKVGRRLTKEFYIRYADMRQDAFEQLSQDNPTIPRHDVLTRTQTLLDRVLFVAFSEDRGLLPTDTIRKAYEHRDPYHPRSVWENFRALFGAINEGNAALGVYAYNGGLFAKDDLLDSLNVSDEVCRYFRDLGSYDYRPANAAGAGDSGSLIDVDILGHIFEQSITDLEKLRNELDGRVEPLGPEKHKTRRKKEGAFYTPSFITRYIIEQALGGVLRDRYEQLRKKHSDAAKGTARSSLADPAIYQLDRLTKPQRAALVAFWESWQDELMGVRMLDPACGSGAFLIEAFDQLHTTYQLSNDRLAELRGHRTLFDVDKRILENNLYGVDLNQEAIEICRLSLWIKTAQRGKALTSLDRQIRVGNSIIADPAVHARALDWQTAFPEVFLQGGFDVVVGNPPYLRQEWISEYKPYLQSAYKAYHGSADLYVYFYELGLRVLKPGGLLSFIVTNKWMKAGYGEPLRRLFAQDAWIRSVVDFGHAKQIFEDADVFPSIIVARKPTDAPKPTTARLCTIPREQLRIDDLSRQIATEGVELPLQQLGSASWQLESDAVTELMAKIDSSGEPLQAAVGAQPIYGLKTSCNDAFFVDASQRAELIARDPKCDSILMPYLRGQDIDRWSCSWDRRWLVAIKSSGDFDWPWSAATEPERIFQDTYPSLYDHMRRHEAALKSRKTNYRHWWELAPFGSWARFSAPKIIYQEIQFHPCYAIERNGFISNNKTFILPTDDLYLLAVLNSPLMWWHNWRSLPHMKDEALTPVAFIMERLPIARPSDALRNRTHSIAGRLVEITEMQQAMRRALLDWLRVEHDIEKPGLKLQAPTGLDSDAFVNEVKRIRGKKNPLSAAALKSLRDEHVRTIEPSRAQAVEAIDLESRLSDLVNEAYGLTADEILLLWKTAPPRMPLSRVAQ